MLDDTLLDDPAALRRADHDRALLALAGSGARVRTALRLAEAAGIDRLPLRGHPERRRRRTRPLPARVLPGRG
ncbi:hypothetical protein ACWC5I_30230, partial [Kitasatospora sp. NPDC001574]